MKQKLGVTKPTLSISGILGGEMSQENVDWIKAGFDAHNRGDVDALVEVYDSECVFETLLLGTHHGNEAVRLIYEENQKTLSGRWTSRSPSCSPSRVSGLCESRPSETRKKSSRPRGCRSS